MKRASLLLALLALPLFSGFLAPVPAVSAQSRGLVLWPNRIQLEARPGESLQANVHLLNETGRPVAVLVAIGDFAQDEKAGLVFYRAGCLSNSCAQWALLDGDPTPLGNEEQLDFPVTLNVPASAPSGGYYASLFFKLVESSEGSWVDLAASLTCLLYVKVNGDGPAISAAARIADADAPEFFCGGDFGLEVALENTGNIHVHVAARADLTGLWGRHIAEVDLGEVILLPGSRQTLRAVLDGPPLAERIKTRFVIGYHDIDGNLVNESNASYTLCVGWPLLVAFTCLFCLALAVMLRRRLVRRKPPANRTQANLCEGGCGDIVET